MIKNATNHAKQGFQRHCSDWSMEIVLPLAPCQFSNPFRRIAKHNAKIKIIGRLKISTYMLEVRWAIPNKFANESYFMTHKFWITMMSLKRTKCVDQCIEPTIIYAETKEAIPKMATLVENTWSVDGDFWRKFSNWAFLLGNSLLFKNIIKACTSMLFSRCKEAKRTNESINALRLPL